jgi:transposase InsO family protein
MKYRVVGVNKAVIPVTRSCNVLGVSASGYYAWKNRKPSKRQREDLLYLAHIRASFAESRQTYGVRRIHAELQEKGLAMKALQRAIALRQPKPGLIHHSDRGSQYCSNDYQKLLRKHKIEPSMSSKGNCYDNAIVETVFKTIKSELVWRTSFMGRLEAKIAIGNYVDGFHNPRRRHSALGYKSPLMFEAEM